MLRSITYFSIIALLLAATLAPSPAAVRLTLTDGRVLDGVDFRREAGDYIVEMADGDSLVIPADLVAEVHIEGQPPPGEEEPEAEPDDAWRAKSGVISNEPRNLAGSGPVKGAPTGLDQDAEPRTLAGDPVRPPRTSEQLGVFGEQAQFQKDVVKNDWQPGTDWDMTNGVNNWAPSTWSKGVTDPTWTPTSAFDASDDVLERGASQWQKPIVDSSWRPTDAFAGD